MQIGHFETEKMQNTKTWSRQLSHSTFKDTRKQLRSDPGPTEDTSN